MDNSQSLGDELGRLPSRDFPPHGVKAVQSSLNKKAYADMKEGKGAGQQMLLGYNCFL